MKYQTIIEAPAGTVFESLPDVFQGLSQLLELADAVSHRPMPGTREYNGRMLIHMEIKDVTNAAGVMELLAAGISGALGQTWTLVAAQSTFKHKQFDVNGDPVMIDSGVVDLNGDPVMVQEEAVNVATPLSEAYFLNFMPDVPVVDVNGDPVLDVNGDPTYERPTVAAPHKMAGAEPWVMVA